MKTNIRRFILSTLAIVVIILVIILYYDYYSPTAVVGRKNLSNVLKLRNGMPSDSVLLIMGRPDTILPPYKEKYPYTQYRYKTNDESNPNITIIINTNRVVEKIYSPGYEK